MDVSDIPVVGRLVAAGGILGDLILHSGELVAFLVVFIVEGVLGSPELLVGLLTTLNRLASRVQWLPADLINQAMTAGLIALLVVYVGRYLDRLTDSNDSS
jgi:hypothetical protein